MRTVLRLGLVAVVCSVAAARAEDPKPPEGFAALFNGKDLTGWKATGKADQWVVEEGVITCRGGGGGWLLSEKDYGDFELRVEYRFRDKATNSGIALRTPAKGDPAYVGMEIQLIDDENWPGKLADYQHTGSIYDVQPAKPAANKPIGEWNSMRIVCKGRTVTIEQNGKELVAAKLDDYQDRAKENHPGLRRASGKVGFQSYNRPVEFRNVFIKELK